jgi:hypothetical protein
MRQSRATVRQWPEIGALRCAIDVAYWRVMLRHWDCWPVVTAEPPELALAELAVEPAESDELMQPATHGRSVHANPFGKLSSSRVAAFAAVAAHEARQRQAQVS